MVRKKLETVKVFPDSRLPFNLHKSVSFTEKRPARKPETGIKDAFEEMKQEFPFRTFRPGQRGLPLQNLCLVRKCSTGTTRKVLFH